MKIAQQINNIVTHQTNGELEALLLESEMIKSRLPTYNRKLRAIQKLVMAVSVQDKNGYLKVSLTEVDSNSLEPANFENILGIYSSKSKARRIIENYVKIYGICPKMVGLEKGSGACFMFQLKKCNGACVNLEIKSKHNFRILTAFQTTRMKSWPYPGPILLEENVVQSESRSGLVVDQWCIIAHLSENIGSDVTIEDAPRQFDLDTYKILRSYISNKKSGLSIKLLNSAQLNSLLVGAD